MKKYLSIFILLMTTGVMNAQLEVDSIGRVNINSPSNKPATVNVEGNGMLLKGTRNGATTSIGNPNPVIEAQNNSSGSYWATGFRGACLGQGGTSNCGVLGMATEGGAHKNFGMIGSLYGPSIKGAGVLGTNRWSSLSLSSFTKSYAGYFDGDVHIQGNITYSGSITGNVLLSMAPPSGNDNPESRATVSPEAWQTARSLSVLDLQTFYQPVPKKAEKKEFREEDFAGLDSVEIEAIKRSLAEGDGQVDMMGEQVLSKQHYGLDAEQLSEIYPDLVYENEDGSKSINYIEMVPLLVQSIKELTRELAELKGEKTSQEVKRETTGIDNVGSEVDIVRMDQNKPNPFSESTVINLNIPKDIKTASILICDLSGKQVKSIPVTERGKTDITVYASELTDGMYIYSLVTDGKVKETRRMIVSHE